MVTGQAISCARTITIEVVNILYMQPKSNIYTCTATTILMLMSTICHDTDVMRLLVILLPEHNMFCGSVTV